VDVITLAAFGSFAILVAAWIAAPLRTEPGDAAEVSVLEDRAA
jgi:hypothetical protein